MRRCKCGCGEWFEPRVEWQRFKTTTHKRHFERHARKQLKLRVRELEERVARLEQAVLETAQRLK